ncbi:30778_t:CDS:2, partial [Racocetra persica]
YENITTFIPTEPDKSKHQNNKFLQYCSYLPGSHSNANDIRYGLNYTHIFT